VSSCLFPSLLTSHADGRNRKGAISNTTDHNTAEAGSSGREKRRLPFVPEASGRESRETMPQCSNASNAMAGGTIREKSIFSSPEQRTPMDTTSLKSSSKSPVKSPVKSPLKKALKLSKSPPPHVARSDKSPTKKVLIGRKQFLVVKSIYDQYDSDGDGEMTREEFVCAHSKLSSTSNVSGTDLFASIDKQNKGRVGLAEWLHKFFPYLPMVDVRRAVAYYKPKPPPSPPPTPPKTLHDCPGAAEEISAIFGTWDTEGKGHVNVADIASPLYRCGITAETAHEWIKELRNGSEGAFDAADLARVLEPVYTAELENAAEEQVEETSKAQLTVVLGINVGSNLLAQGA